MINLVSEDTRNQSFSAQLEDTKKKSVLKNKFAIFYLVSYGLTVLILRKFKGKINKFD